jgi:hypothetical protein
VAVVRQAEAVAEADLGMDLAEAVAEAGTVVQEPMDQVDLVLLEFFIL